MDQREVLGVASALYREDEQRRFDARSAEVYALRERMRESPDLDAELQAAWAKANERLEQMPRLKNACGEKPFAKSYEMHLLRAVARQCLILHYLDNGDAMAAADFTLRRVGCPEDPGARGATVSVTDFLEEQGYLGKAAETLRSLQSDPDAPIP